MRYLAGIYFAIMGNLEPIQFECVFHFDHMIEVGWEFDWKCAVGCVKVPVWVVGGKEQFFGLAKVFDKLVKVFGFFGFFHGLRGDPEVFLQVVRILS